jgi:hypothetical protein
MPGNSIDKISFYTNQGEVTGQGVDVLDKVGFRSHIAVLMLAAAASSC